MKTEASESSVSFYDYHPTPSDILQEVRQGLQKTQKSLSPKFFYDQRGSNLFQEITRLTEYYPTRTELGIFSDHKEEISSVLGKELIVVEFGCGSSEKIYHLLELLECPKAYLAIDISREHLTLMTEDLAQSYPSLEVIAVCADFTQPLSLPLNGQHKDFRRLGFFPGSSIGNFEPKDAARFLKILSKELGPKSGLLIGVDLKKDPRILNRAYNDSEGITEKFNKNLLRRINRECQGDFKLEDFSHRAFYNPHESRIEMHLISQKKQQVRLNGSVIPFEKGESIHTENSYKYELGEFQALAEGCGWVPVEAWTDEKEFFSVQYFERG